MTRAELLAQRLASIEEEIDRLDAIADDAQNSQRPNLAAAANAASRWASLRDKRQRLIVEIEAVNEPDPLTVIRMYRDAAFVDAASSLGGLLTMESALMEERRREDQERKREELARTPGGDLEDTITEMLTRLPSATRARILARFAPDDAPTPN